MVRPALKVSVRVHGKSASSGDSFKLVLFSANDGQEPCFQKGCVQNTALPELRQAGGSCLKGPSQVTTALCVTAPRTKLVLLDLFDLPSHSPDGRVRFIYPRDHNEFKRGVHDESTAQVHDESADLVHDEFLAPAEFIATECHVPGPDDCCAAADPAIEFDASLHGTSSGRVKLCLDQLACRLCRLPCRGVARPVGRAYAGPRQP